MKKIIFILLIGFAFSCETKNEPSMKRYELRQLVKEEKTTKNSSGSFFFVVGEYRNSEKKELVVRVFANTEIGFRYFEIPLRKIIIRIDNSIPKPYLQFYDRIDIEDDLYFFITCTFCGKYDGIYLICPEKYLPEQLLPINL